MICVIFLAPKLAKILAKNTAIYVPKSNHKPGFKKIAIFAENFKLSPKFVTTTPTPDPESNIKIKRFGDCSKA
jgi:hypothetical protein